MSETAEWVLVTPEMAAEFLTHNSGNRKMKEERIRAYAETMRAGLWRTNGEPIQFATSGKMLNGQNRCRAVITAGIPTTFLVVRGLDEDTQESIDIGASRTLADILKLRDERLPNVLSGVIRQLYIWDHTKNTDRRIVGGSGQFMSKISTSLLLAYFDIDPDRKRFMRNIAHTCEQSRRKTAIPTGVMAPLLREFEVLDPDDAKDFLYRLEHGLPSPGNYGEDDPIIRFEKAKDRLHKMKGSYSKTELAALLIKTWNAYRDGISIRQLAWRSGGASPEPFPKAR